MAKAKAIPNWSMDFSPHTPEEYWLAGWFEGEGCITSGGAARQGNTLVLAANNTDEDVIRTVHRIAGCGSVSGPRPMGPGRRPIWSWRVTGDMAARLLMRLMPLFHERRKTRARERLEIWLGVDNQLTRPVQPCGTQAAYSRHRKAGEQPCELCMEARRKYMRQWEPAYRAKAKEKINASC